MLANRFLGGHPLIRTPLILAYHTTVANGRPIIHAKEFLTDTARTYLTAEDSLIGLP